MKQTIRKRRDEIRIRAVPNWEPDRREEGPFLPVTPLDLRQKSGPRRAVRIATVGGQ